MKNMKNSKLMIVRVALVLGLCMMATWASAMVVIVGNESGYPEPGSEGYGVAVSSPGAAPVDFLSNVGGVVYEPIDIARDSSGNFYVLEGSEPGDSYDGGTTPEDAPLVHKFGPGGNYKGVFVPRQDYGGVDLTPDGEARFITFAPNGDLLVSLGEYGGSSDNGVVLRFDGRTGEFIDIFLANGAGTVGYSLKEPGPIVFDPQGNFYIAGEFPGDGHNDAILKFDAGRNFLSVVLDDSDSIFDESRALAFRDGKLYVGNADDDNVLVISFDSGGNTDDVAEFVTEGSGGLEEAVDIGFGPDGLLYVAGGDEGEGLFRYNGTTGEFVDSYADLSATEFNDPYGFVFTVPQEYEVPLLNAWTISLLVVLLGGLGVFLEARRKRQSAAA